VLWLAQKVVIPKIYRGFLEGLCLRLALTWWAEAAQIYVDGCLIQEGDLFDCSTRVLLSVHLYRQGNIGYFAAGESGRHDHGALVRSLCVYESSSDDCLSGFIADELAVLQRYLDTPEKLPILAAAVAE